MQINESILIEIGTYLGVNPTQLAIEMKNAPYADKTHAGNEYPSGTGKASERAFVYALVRMLTPDIVQEVGTGWGAMTTQALSACMNNNVGVVYSTDVVAQRWGKPVGSLIHNTMRTRLRTTVNGTWQADKPDLILEDSDHTYDTTKAHWLRGMQILPEGGVILSHDACNRPDVLRAIRDCDIDPLIVQLEPRAPGFALYQHRKNARVHDSMPDMDVSLASEVLIPVAPPEAPKKRTSRRSRRASKATT